MFKWGVNSSCSCVGLPLADVLDSSRNLYRLSVLFNYAKDEVRLR